MDNQKPNPAATLPWYDDRVETVEYTVPVAEPAEEPTQYTPKQIYDYLNRKIWKQNEAKKAASVIMYNCLRGIRSTSLFCGPSGCGKTQIWRALQQLYPNRIEIADVSNLTQDGWKGSLKWKDLLRTPIFRSGLLYFVNAQLNDIAQIETHFDMVCAEKALSVEPSTGKKGAVGYPPRPV